MFMHYLYLIKYQIKKNLSYQLDINDAYQNIKINLINGFNNNKERLNLIKRLFKKVHYLYNIYLNKNNQISFLLILEQALDGDTLIFIQLIQKLDSIL